MVEHVVQGHGHRIWAGAGGRCRRLGGVRLDRALRADLTTALRSGPIRLFILLQLGAAVVLVWRRGSDLGSVVLLVWLGMAVLAFVAWWAGRHRLAHAMPDPVPQAGTKALLALLGAAGMVLFGSGLAREVGFVLVACGLGGWLWSAWRTREAMSLRARLVRDPRPFIPLLLLVALPRLLAAGPLYLVATFLALPSGIGQQLLFVLGLYEPLEAATGRRAAAAVSSALLFGLIHVPFVLPDNEGDLMAALANVVIFQSSVGLIACLAYQRHRAVLPIGVAHALAIA